MQLLWEFLGYYETAPRPGTTSTDFYFLNLTIKKLASVVLMFFRECSSASITILPIVPDFAKYPEKGRDTNTSFGEVGHTVHWPKSLINYMFI